MLITLHPVDHRSLAHALARALLTLPPLTRLDPLANTHAEALADARVHLVLEACAEDAFDARPHVFRDHIARRGREGVVRVECYARMLAEGQAA